VQKRHGSKQRRERREYRKEMDAEIFRDARPNGHAGSGVANRARAGRGRDRDQ
jgi:hypothetical protein